MHVSFEEAGHLLDRFHALVARGFQPPRAVPREATEEAQQKVFRSELAAACLACGLDDAATRRVADALLDEVPALRSRLAEDVEAALAGDPAARSREEIEGCYPGYRAVVAHRLAHALERLDVPLLPRMLSEAAHRETGIDIHPGARIGRRFFIDHGTGVVIGETTVIGDSVTLYQGVTIGARNLPRDPEGRVQRGAKRHPTIGDRVVIYANATLLGGDTVVGDECVIGAGVWLTDSIPSGTLVVQDTPRPRRLPRPDRTSNPAEASSPRPPES